MGAKNATMSGSLKFAVSDFWRGFDPSADPIVRALTGSLGGQRPDTDVRSAELLLFSVYGDRHALARGTKVGCSGEARWAPASQTNWTIDSRWLATANHFRLPQWAYAALTDRVPYLPSTSEASRFCNFIYSNPACGMRNAFFAALNDREHVDALGAVGRNASHPRLSGRHDANWGQTKREVLGDYRFTIAFENEECPGYTTEKIVDAWLANSVPIYWGNPAVTADFPPGSFLSLYESGSMRRLIEDVLEAHHDSERYAQLQMSNPFRKGFVQAKLVEYDAELHTFCAGIVDDAIEHAKNGRFSRRTVLRARTKHLRRGVARAIRPRLARHSG